MSTYPKYVENRPAVTLMGDRVDREVWELSEQEVLVGGHLKAACAPPCPLHHPTEHTMDDFSLHWRGDRGIFERICPHGVGHPDPDTLQHINQEFGKRQADVEAVHGCDGCCADAYDIR